MKRVYLDNAASTPLLPEVKQLILESMDWDLGNPSAIHVFGRGLRSKIEGARTTVAKCLNASVGEIFFTSGGTESNNTALNSAVDYLGVKRIISSPIEHPSIKNTLKYLQEYKGIEITLLDVDVLGHPDMNQLSDLLARSNVRTLVSLMHANNEIGTMIDLELVSSICQAHGALFHSDTVQSVGHEAIDLQKVGLSFLTASAHKFHGPKGAGILYCNQDNISSSLLKGGSQERNMRAGTESAINIFAGAKALEIATQHLDENKQYLLKLREHFKSGLLASFGDLEFNGAQESGFLFTLLNVGFPKSAKSDMLIPLLDIEGIAVAGSSACSSGAETQSSVIAAIKPGSDIKPIRFSFSHLTTYEEIDYTLEILRKVLLS